MATERGHYYRVTEDNATRADIIHTYITKSINMANTRLDELLPELAKAGYRLADPRLLEARIWEDAPEFGLEHDHSFGKDRIFAMMVFGKHPRSGRYRLSRHLLRLEREGFTEQREQVFSFHKGMGVSLREGYNLLCGRAVYKWRITSQGMGVPAWMELDFGEAHPDGFATRWYYDNHGFDLHASLLEVWEAEGKPRWNKKRLLAALRAGEQPIIRYESGGGRKQAVLRARPRYKRIYLNHTVAVRKPVFR